MCWRLRTYYQGRSEASLVYLRLRVVHQKYGGEDGQDAFPDLQVDIKDLIVEGDRLSEMVPILQLANGPAPVPLSRPGRCGTAIVRTMVHDGAGMSRSDGSAGARFGLERARSAALLLRTVDNAMAAA